MEQYKEMIASACQEIYAVVRKTSLDFATEISAKHANNVWLKREDQQPVFSYKIRGAYNLIANLSVEDKQRGLITASAGNHAQGVALVASKLNISAIIVMPKTSPAIKIKAVENLGAEVVLNGNIYDDAKEHALRLAELKNKVYVPAYDHPMIIAGQATVAVEILEQHPTQPDIIFVPVGGGGLIAGMVAYLREVAPAIKIIGVEPREAACMHAALKAGKPVTLDNIGIFADGAAVCRAGDEPFRIIKDVVDEILLVNVDEICAAVQDIFEDTRSIPEPAGALALAGLKKYVAREGITNKDLVTIFSGANVDFDRLRHIAELSALGENREALIGTKLLEKPGSFLQYCHDLGHRQITEFNYRYGHAEEAYVFTGLQLKNGVQEKIALLEKLRSKNYQVVDLSSDEMAKMHVRYMIGGHADNVDDELIYRFEFPERPGALLYFLNKMSGRWNISLFHYRNHGAAYGRILMGIQVPECEHLKFNAFLDDLGIQYCDETDNIAYSLFLK